LHQIPNTDPPFKAVMGDGKLDITFDQVGQHNLVQLKTLNCAIFPVKYQDKVYQDILACGEVTQLAYHNGNLVGAMACRLENSPQVHHLYRRNLPLIYN
jgi:N-alpha-acetyltransferase 50